jgi:hypothetical protein
MILLLLLPSSFLSWRYALMPVDPDFALFSLPAITGSWYGKDYPDCKTPAIHVWFWLLSKIVGKNVERIRFLHYMLMGFGGSTLVLVLTGDFWKALAFSTLINTGWFYAFHGNVGQVPAVLIALSLGVHNPWVAAAAFTGAVLFEPKLAFSLLAAVAIYGWYAPFLVYAGLGAVVWLLIKDTQIGVWIWESSVTIPARMAGQRGKPGWSYPWVPWYTAVAFLYFLPWVMVSVWSKPDILYWIPPLIYMIFISLGKVIRNNHMLQPIAWIAMAINDPTWVLALTAIDWVTSGLYLGNLWARFYPALDVMVHEAKKVGQHLKKYEGTLWANGVYSSCVYLYSEKPVLYGMTENIEVREVAFERVRQMKDKWVRHPADWLVETDYPLIRFTGRGYDLVDRGSTVAVWRKKDDRNPV